MPNKLFASHLYCILDWWGMLQLLLLRIQTLFEESGIARWWILMSPAWPLCDCGRELWLWMSSLSFALRYDCPIVWHSKNRVWKNAARLFARKNAQLTQRRLLNELQKFHRANALWSPPETILRKIIQSLLWSSSWLLRPFRPDWLYQVQGRVQLTYRPHAR